MSSRLFSSTMSFTGDESDLEGGKGVKDEESSRTFKPRRIPNQALLSGLAYCISSCSMTLVNKLVLSGFDFHAGIFLMLYQNIVSVIIVSMLSYLRLISTEPLTLKLLWVWLPVNTIFVGMLITSMFRQEGRKTSISGWTYHNLIHFGLPLVCFLFRPNNYIFLFIILVAIIISCSLQYINVAMVTVLKNVTNVITAIGETYLFGQHHGGIVWSALILMIISAVCGGTTDLTFHALGYTWQMINCFLAASYSLTLRRIMSTTTKQVTASGNLNEFSMVFLNNLLSLPLGLLLMFMFKEVDYLYETPLLRVPIFWVVITSSGFLGLAISFTSLWFLHQTSATTYCLMGSLNKIPLSIAGILLFGVPTSLENFTSILFGVLAGVFFAKAKMRENSQS